MVGSHQDSNIGHARLCSWLHSSSQVKLTAIHRPDTTEKILEHGGEAEALKLLSLKHHRGWDRLHMKGKRSNCIRSTLPLPQARATPHQEGSTEPTIPPMGTKSTGWTSSSPSIVGCFLGVPLWPHLTGKAWLEHLESCVTQQCSSRDYSRQSWSSTEQSQGHHPARELRVRVSLIQDHKQSFSRVGAGSLSLPRQRS